MSRKFCIAVRSVGLVVMSLMLPMAVQAAETKSLGEFGVWRAYSYAEKDGKVCYASAGADRLVGGDKGRKPTYLSVTHRPGSSGEVSITAPWGFKKDSDVELQVGGMKTNFFTKGDAAWTKQAGADKAVISALAKGDNVVVHATPAHASAVTDTISLGGFSHALAAIDRECGVKR